MSIEKCYIEDEEYVWFPRLSGDPDIGLRLDSIKGVKPDPENKEFSFVLYSKGLGHLRAFELAKSVARTIWGKGNFKKKKGTYVPK